MLNLYIKSYKENGITQRDPFQKQSLLVKITLIIFTAALYMHNPYLHDQHLSEDIASEALIKLWENWDESYTTVQRKAFLLTIIRNKCLDHLRKIQVNTKTHEELTEISQRELVFRISLLESTVPQELFISDIQKIVDNTLKQLPEQTRLIFKLSRI